MSIASLGGATVDDKGNRDYPASGGYIGGLSMQGGNWAYWTGAGAAHNRFTPSVYGDTSALTDITQVDGGGDGGIDPTGGGGVIIGAGSSSTPIYGSGISGGGLPAFIPPSSPYRGSGQIQSGGNSLISAMQSIFSQYQAGTLSLADAQAQAQQLAGYLYNPSVFYQPRHGDDYNILNRLKATAQGILSSIASWVSPTVVTNCANPPCTIIPSGGSSGGDTGANGTAVPSNTDIMSLLAGLLQPSQPTQLPAPLTTFTPTGANTATGSGVNMSKLVILVVVGIVGYFLYKKYA